ncbi:MAG: SIMPL domain-containing protein [Bacteroides sp.]|nr:SIMPL domain-containing protein [Ruminococcus flavefaciens]MCM1555258.1 SIMPL domain-containing protein [Bacteroides sp.]
MKTIRFLSAIATLFILGTLSVNAQGKPVIEVSGSASISIVPDRISIEIGMEEYYKKQANGDSVVVKIPEIEQQVRAILREFKVADSMVTLSDIGNYSYRSGGGNFLMAKRISVVLTGFGQLEAISENMGMEGITSFQISSLDNSDMEEYNRQGLKAALDAARAKAEFIAGNEKLKILMPWEIVENGPTYYDAPRMKAANVMMSADGYSGGMESMRRIVRRYSVRVKYLVGKGK